MKINKQFFLIILISSFFISCNEGKQLKEPRGKYDDGILISNQGAFKGGTGTINYISNNYVFQEAKVFQKVNNENLGTIVQSIAFLEDKIFIVANVANKISIANRYTMKKIGSITNGLVNPRYMTFSKGKAYVTNWGNGKDKKDDYIAVIDLKSNKIINKISVVEGPERIIAKDDNLYISHKGGWGSGNSITIINSNDDKVIKNIKVGDIPDELFINNDGNIVVSCEGKAISKWNSTEKIAKICIISSDSKTVSKTINLDSGIHPKTMVNSNRNIYFSSGDKVYEINTNTSNYSYKPIFSNLSVYAMNVYKNKLYTADARDYKKNGILKIWDVKSRKEYKSFQVGLIPGGIYFNK